MHYDSFLSLFNNYEREYILDVKILSSKLKLTYKLINFRRKYGLSFCEMGNT